MGSNLALYIQEEEVWRLEDFQSRDFERGRKELLERACPACRQDDAEDNQHCCLYVEDGWLSYAAARDRTS